jgi:Lrp/AsnC family transcriptional regulator for asnA, asnC and gidA
LDRGGRDDERTRMPNGRTGPRRQDELSPLDKRIIEHLQADGRRPFTQIANELGVSDPGKLGFQQALIGIRCEPGRLVAVAEALAELPEVDYVVVTTGRFDILIETVSEDNEDLLRFLTDRLQAIEGVRDSETFTYLRLVKQTYQFGTR